MDEIWERAVEAALDGQTDHLATRTLTLDGAVKCVQGRLPPPSLLERFQNLHHLSIANIGVSSLEQFPRLRNLQRLILSDNRITVGLEFLVEAGLDSLRDLDLSNNRIQFVEDLAPLAELKLVSLDLYECPVTRVKDYRSRVFALIRTLKYLDKTDAEGNERPESDDEDDEEGEEDEEEEEEEGDEEDPGSGEVDGDERPEAPWMSNGHSERLDGVLDVDEDEESDAEDDESEQATGVNGTSYRSNGFRLQAVNGEEVGEDDGDDSESGEEIDEEEVGEDNDVVEVHEIEDSDNEEDGVDDEEDEEEDEDEEEVDNDDQRGLGVPGSTGRLMNAGEIDGHEQGDDDEDGDGETGEDDLGIEDDGEFGDEDDDGEEEDEESGEGYLVQPVSQVEDCDVVRSDIQPINEDNDPDEEEEEVEDDLHLPIRDQSLPSSSRPKRKRDSDDDDDDDDEDDDDDDDEDGVDDEEG